MNEHIAELALKAGFSSWVLSPSKETMSDTPELLEKFAELIVKECANVLTARGMFYDGFGDRQIAAQAMETAADLVKYHFGVTQN